MVVVVVMVVVMAVVVVVVVVVVVIVVMVVIVVIIAVVVIMFVVVMVVVICAFHAHTSSARTIRLHTLMHSATLSLSLTHSLTHSLRPSPCTHAGVTTTTPWSIYWPESRAGQVSTNQITWSQNTHYIPTKCTHYDKQPLIVYTSHFCLRETQPKYRNKKCSILIG